ncbi:MAG: hypothetical protein NVSMB1_06600 [Polyangiales bacterium]
MHEQVKKTWLLELARRAPENQMNCNGLGHRLAFVAATIACLQVGCASSNPVDESESPGVSEEGMTVCGRERWAVKTGVDGGAKSIRPPATPTTIASLRALVPPSSLLPTTRASPVEDQFFVLKNVSLTFSKIEADQDLHMVLTDSAGHTMIAEIPSASCVTSGPWASAIATARKTATANLPSMGSQRLTVSVVGVGFFDKIHGQTGVAPNGIELHPVLGICFGAHCTPPSP